MNCFTYLKITLYKKCRAKYKNINFIDRRQMKLEFKALSSDDDLSDD